MTIAAQTYRNDYAAQANRTAYPYTFKISEDTDLDVYVNGVLVTSGYTVSGAGSESGGTVTFTDAPGCLAVALVRDVPYTQETELPETGPFPSASVEDALDKVTMLVQQALGIARAAWRFSAGSSHAASGFVLDEPIGGRYPRIKSACDGVEFVCLTTAGVYADPVTTKGDLIQGNDGAVQERLALGTMGRVVVSGPSGKVEYAAGGTVLLRNKVDAQADAGRFLGLSMDCDSAFVTSDVSSCTRVGIVTTQSVGDDCLGMVLWTGAATVNADGNIARGHYVKKSTVAGAVITTCVSMMDHRPIPKGALGLAIGHSASGCVAILKFAVPAPGMQGLAIVRRNAAASVALTPCTQVDLVAQGLVLADSCNDIVVVKNPSSITVNLCTSFTNKKNGRDGSESGNGLQPGDVHFYWVYEGASGSTYGRASSKGPETSGPALQACETHAAYSHSVYWDGNCLRRHTVRGRRVSFDCVQMTGTCLVFATIATCETRASLVTLVPAVATNVHLQARVYRIASTGGEVYLGHRLNCIARVLSVRSDNASFETIEEEITLPNVNQEIYYRSNSTAMELSLTVLGFDVPNGD